MNHKCDEFLRVGGERLVMCIDIYMLGQFTGIGGPDNPSVDTPAATHVSIADLPGADKKYLPVKYNPHHLKPYNGEDA